MQKHCNRLAIAPLSQAESNATERQEHCNQAAKAMQWQVNSIASAACVWSNMQAATK